MWVMSLGLWGHVVMSLGLWGHVVMSLKTCPYLQQGATRLCVLQWLKVRCPKQARGRAVAAQRTRHPPPVWCDAAAACFGPRIVGTSIARAGNCLNEMIETAASDQRTSLVGLASEQEQSLARR